MARANLCNMENVRRARYAQIGATVVAACICGYLAITTLATMQEVWSAQRQLRRGKTDVAGLSRQAANERKLESKRPPPSDGGVDSFAVEISRWASERKIRIESFVPEGSPTPAEITFGPTTT